MSRFGGDLLLRNNISDDSELETLPMVIADRCVHTRVTQANCCACVDACPVNAWVMDDESLGIDTESCDGCGLCAPACPQGAIVSQQANMPVPSKNHTSALFACDKSGVNGKDGIIPCLHILGLQQLLRLYRSGTRHLSIATGDCGSCVRNASLHLPNLLEQLNGMLENRNLTTLTLQIIEREEWNQQSQNAKQTFRAPTISRRAFFRKATTSSVQFGMDLAGCIEERAFTPPGKILPRTKLNDVVPFSPRIDSTKCNGCNACARLCPQDAITLSINGDSHQYRLDAECCTGCGICVDVCFQKAVSVDHWKAQAQFTLLLSAHRCCACGVPFHIPAVIKASTSDLCAVCSNANHARNLYQVMEPTQSEKSS